jgi:hypothetical protein
MRIGRDGSPRTIFRRSRPKKRQICCAASIPRAGTRPGCPRRSCADCCRRSPGTVWSICAVSGEERFRHRKVSTVLLSAGPGGPFGRRRSRRIRGGRCGLRAAIVDCADGLTVRARRAWYLRILYEIGSAEIARDPAVATTPAGVDAMLARCREQMRSCLAGKGFVAGPFPPGTFARLWEMTSGKVRP